MNYKNIIGISGAGGAIVLLENGLYARVGTSKDPDIKTRGIFVSRHIEAHAKWGEIEYVSEKDIPPDVIESVKYNLKNCTQFFGS